MYRPRMSADRHFNLKTGPGKGSELRKGANMAKLRENWDDIFRKKVQASSAESDDPPANPVHDGDGH